MAYKKRTGRKFKRRKYRKYGGGRRGGARKTFHRSIRKAIGRYTKKNLILGGRFGTVPPKCWLTITGWKHYHLTNDTNTVIQIPIEGNSLNVPTGVPASNFPVTRNWFIAAMQYSNYYVYKSRVKFWIQVIANAAGGGNMGVPTGATQKMINFAIIPSTLTTAFTSSTVGYEYPRTPLEMTQYAKVIKVPNTTYVGSKIYKMSYSMSTRKMGNNKTKSWEDDWGSTMFTPVGSSEDAPVVDAQQPNQTWYWYFVFHDTDLNTAVGSIGINVIARVDYKVMCFNPKRVNTTQMA